MIIYYLSVAAFDAGSREFDKYVVGAKHQALGEWERIKKTERLHKTDVAAAYVENDNGDILERWQRDGLEEVWDSQAVPAAIPDPPLAENQADPTPFAASEPEPTTDGGNFAPPTASDDNGLSGSLVGDEVEG